MALWISFFITIGLIAATAVALVNIGLFIFAKDAEWFLKSICWQGEIYCSRCSKALESRFIAAYGPSSEKLTRFDSFTGAEVNPTPKAGIKGAWMMVCSSTSDSDLREAIYDAPHNEARRNQYSWKKQQTRHRAYWNPYKKGYTPGVT